MKPINSIFIFIAGFVTFLDASYNTLLTRSVLYSVILVLALMNGMAYQLKGHLIKTGGVVFYSLLAYALLLSIISGLGTVKEIAEAMQLLFLPVLFLLLVNSSKSQIYLIFFGVIAGKAGYAFYVALGKLTGLYPVHELYVPGMLFVVALIVKKGVVDSEQWYVRIKPFFAFCMIGCFIILMVSSRGDLISLIAIISYIIFYKSNMVRKFWLWISVIIPMGVALIVFLLQPAQLPSWLAQPNTWTIGQRANLWGTSMAMAYEEFPTGVGYKKFNELYREHWLPQSKLEKFSWDLIHVESPHSQIMLTLAEGGGLAALSLIGIFYSITYYLKDTKARIGQIILVSIWSSFSTDWFYGSTLIVVIVSLAVVIKARIVQREEKMSENTG
jgi:hypothetical protein